MIFWGKQDVKDSKIFYLDVITEEVIRSNLYLCEVLLVSCKKAITSNWYKLGPP